VDPNRRHNLGYTHVPHDPRATPARPSHNAETRLGARLAKQKLRLKTQSQQRLRHRPPIQKHPMTGIQGSQPRLRTQEAWARRRPHQRTSAHRPRIITYAKSTRIDRRQERGETLRAIIPQHKKRRSVDRMIEKDKECGRNQRRFVANSNRNANRRSYLAIGTPPASARNSRKNPATGEPNAELRHAHRQHRRSPNRKTCGLT